MSLDVGACLTRDIMPGNKLSPSLHAAAVFLWGSLAMPHGRNMEVPDNTYYNIFPCCWEPGDHATALSVDCEHS